MKRLFIHPLGIIILTAISLFLFLSLEKTINQHQLSGQQVTSLKEQTTQLEKQIIDLETRVEQASQSAYQEQMRRDELLMQKPGEYVVKVEYTQDLRATPEPTPDPTPWQEWKSLIF